MDYLPDGFFAKAQVLSMAFVVVLVNWRLLPRMVKVVRKGQQLRVEKLTDVVVYNGPCTVFLNPLGYRNAEYRDAISLGTLDYVRVRDTSESKDRIERGPKLLLLGAYDQVDSTSGGQSHGHGGRSWGNGGAAGSAVKQGVTLSKTEYLWVEDQLTGEFSTVRGPCVWLPGPHDVPSAKKNAIALQENEYVRLQDTATGKRWVAKGKDLVFLEPTWLDGGKMGAWTLKSYEYVRLLDSITGKVSVHRGEGIVFPSATENLLDKQILAAVELSSNEYVRIIDQNSGSIRVVSGPTLVFLGASDKVLDDGKQRAVNVDDENAVLVRDMRNGQLRLVTEKQLFFPGPDDKIEEVRPLIRLADYEAVIVKDKDGVLNFHYGDPKKNSASSPRCFFLQPYTEIVELRWSSGLRRKSRDLIIGSHIRFDCRPQFMWNEIDCRTQDNVELVLETTLFWEVIDLSVMVGKTGNLPGDIYNQIRSQFIKHCAQATLKSFMEQLHTISGKIFAEDQDFYTSRGVKVHSLEITKYMCSEKRTSEVLQQIIEETTNRLNRLSHAESENEVRIYKMQGQLEEEKLNSQLLEIQHRHAKAEAAVSGEAEAERVAAFVKRLEEHVPALDDRISIWQTLRKTDALSVISQGGANLYYTPNDVDLSIKCEPRK